MKHLKCAGVMLMRKPLAKGGAAGIASRIADGLSPVTTSACSIASDGGGLKPRDPVEPPLAEVAKKPTATIVRANAVVVAFSRTRDPVAGEFEPAVILSQAGEVDLDALSI